MKKLSLIALILLVGQTVVAGGGKYESSMRSAIDQLYQNNSLEELQSVVSKFERISQAEPEEWLPSYYAALGYVWMTHKEQDVSRHDQFLDQAQKNIDHCNSIIEKSDEVLTLQGYVYMMRVTVDPQTRGAQYSQMSMGAFQKALGINPDNARALLLMAQMKYGTDQFFGNDLTDACNMLKGAAKKLENEQPDDNLSPAWGKKMAKHLVSACE